MMVCGIVTSSTVTASLRSVIDTPVASSMVINLWALTPRQRLRTMMMMMMMYYISRYVYVYIYRTDSYRKKILIFNSILLNNNTIILLQLLTTSY